MKVSQRIDLYRFLKLTTTLSRPAASRVNLEKGFPVFEFDLCDDNYGFEYRPMIAYWISIGVTKGVAEDSKVFETLVDSLVTSHDCGLENPHFRGI